MSVNAVVRLCVGAVLAAVALNFALAGERRVRTRRASAVATGTMLAFLAAAYAAIRLRFGAGPESPPAAVAAGLALLVAGAALNLAGRLALARNWGNQILVYEDHALITAGPYALVRHPLYASLGWMFLGAALVYANRAVWLASLLVFIPAMYYRAALEERALAAAFPEYADYRREVGMLFPKLPAPGAPCGDVEVRRSSFLFCRVSLTLLLWSAVALRSTATLALVFALLALSAALTVTRAPLVRLGDRLFAPGATVLLDLDGMRFAHGLGAGFVGACLGLIWTGAPYAWTAAAAFALVKTSSMLGFCPAERAYRCVAREGCCSFLKKAAC